MDISTVIDQATTLHDLVATFITYAGSIKTAGSFADVAGYTAGEGVLHDEQTYYGVSATIIEKLSAAKDIIAECTAIIQGTVD